MKAKEMNQILQKCFLIFFVLFNLTKLSVVKHVKVNSNKKAIKKTILHKYRLLKRLHQETSKERPKQSSFDIPELGIVKSSESVSIGMVGNNYYNGTWTSSTGTEAGFIKSTQGLFRLTVSSLVEKSLYLEIEIYEHNYLDSKNIAIDQNLKVNSNDDHEFSKIEDLFVEKNKYFYFGTRLAYCNTQISISFLNKFTDEPIFINSDDIDEVKIKGNITSDECKIDLEFSSEVQLLETTQMTVILSISALFQILSIIATVKIIRSNNQNQILLINHWSVGIQVAIDFGLFYFNLFFGSTYLPRYALYILIFGFVHFLSSFVKNFLYGKQFAAMFSRRQLNLRQRQMMRIFFILKILFIIGFGIAFSLFFFQFTWFYYVLFCYPLIQVFHNLSNISKQNLFIWWLHLSFFLNYLFFFSYLKGFPAFFNFSYDIKFPFIVCSQVGLCLLIMIFQRVFGTWFFIPKSMRPGYYNYFRKIDSSSLEGDETCAICLLELTTNPEEVENDHLLDELTKKPHTHFMETPCKHRFHSFCLKTWIDVNLVCPLCKKKVPVIM